MRGIQASLGWTVISQRNKNETRQKRLIAILGDSGIKEIKPYLMKVKLGEKMDTKMFPGATMLCMIDYAKPTMKDEPDFVILHTSTNDVKSANSPEEISDEIIKFALNMKTDNNDIVSSGILPRNDDLNMKGQKVNGRLNV